jgi:hypothetical protein
MSPTTSKVHSKFTTSIGSSWGHDGMPTVRATVLEAAFDPRSVYTDVTELLRRDWATFTLCCYALYDDVTIFTNNAQ